MKKILKALLLSAMTIGMGAACKDTTKPVDNQTTTTTDTDTTDSNNNGGKVDNNGDNTGTDNGGDSGNTGTDNGGDSGNTGTDNGGDFGNTGTDNGGDSGNTGTDNGGDSGNTGTDTPEKTVTGYSLDTTNVKKEYEQGETLDLTGLVGYKNFSDNTKEAVEVANVTPVNGTTLNDLGTTTVTVTLNGSEETFTFDVTVVAAVKKAWTEEEAAFLSEKLFGVVLPFINPDSVIKYDSLYEVVNIDGGAATEDALEGYAAALIAAGFVSTSDSTYKFEKEVIVENSKRYIEVYFAPNESYEFHLEAYSLFYYTFPGKFFAFMASYYFSSDAVPPAFEADHYQFDERNNAIYCYTISTTAVADYSAILEEAGWELLGLDSTTNYYDAVSPDGKYMIHYTYDANFKDLDIIMTPLLSWSDDLIKDFFDDYEGTYVTVPAFTVPGAQYQFVEAANNPLYKEEGTIEFIHADMYVMFPNGTDIDPLLDAYLDNLNTNGWVVSGSDTYFVAKYQVEDEGLFRLEITLDTEDNVVGFTFYVKLDPIPGAGFPATEVSELLGPFITDTLPAFTGENNGFSILNDYYGTGVIVEVNEDGENDAISSYIETLTTAGYYLWGGTTSLYASPNEEILVQVYCGTPGSITIEFMPCPTETWPATKLAKVIKAFFNSEDILPAYDGGFEYGIDIDMESEEFNIYLYLEDEDLEIDDAIADYEEVLIKEKFTFAYVDDNDDNVYASPDGKYMVSPWNDGNTMDIAVFASDATNSKWPVNDLNAFYTENNLTDEIPEYTGEYTSAELGSWFGMTYLFVACDNPTDAMAAYMDFLEDEENGYTYNGLNSGDPVYTSPNGQLTLTFSTESDGFTAIIKVNEVTIPDNEDGFPIDKVIKVFADARDTLPALQDEKATFEFAEYGQIDITVSFENEDDATSYFNSYCELLVVSGFTKTGENAGLVFYKIDGLSFNVMMMLDGADVYITLVPNNK
ncbi:MAG: hypothetical protein K6E21_05300 [Bacilli bacterium]|nr:hypothetical protein [Bacilli bacterium]